MPAVDAYNGNQTSGATYAAFNQQATITGSVAFDYLGTTNTQRLGNTYTNTGAQAAGN